MSDSAEAAWVRRWLGVNIKVPRGLPKPSVDVAKLNSRGLLDAPPVSGKLEKPVHAAPGLVSTTKEYADPTGRHVSVKARADGSVAFAAPSPPIKELTFSGGGGKGAALPGALRALSSLSQGGDGRIMDGVKVVKGASVGSLTAAVAACGMTGDDYAKLMADKGVVNRITEEKTFGVKQAIVGGFVNKLMPEKVKEYVGSFALKGVGLQAVARESMEDSLAFQIEKFKKEKGGALAPEAEKRLEEILGRIEHNQSLRKDKDAYKKACEEGSIKGVTFKEMSDLSKIIPQVKEVEIASTMMKQSVDDGRGHKVSKDVPPQLMMFNAQTTPDLDVSLAARASAALPPVFDQVEVKLGPGVTGTFQDGGVMNNTPASNTVRSERELDPSPESGRMTFMFEESGVSKALKAGQIKGDKDWVNDWITKAPMSANVYGMLGDLAEKPEEIVVVPLIFDKTEKDKHLAGKDLSGLGTTVNFSMDAATAKALQGKLQGVVGGAVEELKKPRTQEYQSAMQMLTCISAADLAILSANDFKDEGSGASARAVEAFRNEVTGVVGELVKAHEAFAKGAGGKAGEAGFAASEQAQALIKRLDALAGGDPDQCGFVARALNKQTSLDPVIAALRHGGAKDLPVMQAGAAVADALVTENWARQIAKDLVYPTLMEDDLGPDGKAFLKLTDQKMRQMRLLRELRDELKGIKAEFSRKPAAGFWRWEIHPSFMPDMPPDMERVPDAERTQKLVARFASYEKRLESVMGR